MNLLGAHAKKGVILTRYDNLRDRPPKAIGELHHHCFES